MFYFLFARFISPLGKKHDESHAYDGDDYGGVEVCEIRVVEQDARFGY